MAGDARLGTQNISFVDNAPGQLDSRGSYMDETRNVAFMQDTTLDEFFSRPVRILEVPWNVSGSLFERFNPWTLFWENPRNKEKIKNYHLLKCTLHLKLIINGNAFYYGRAILGYEPLNVFDKMSPALQKRPNNYFNVDIVRLSQRQHVYINPTTSEGGSLELPFFYPRNALVIPDNAWRDMGDCVLMSINPLLHANGGVDPITISVMAWAENVSFSIPTQAVPEMLECVPEMDEHNKDVISRPASTVARYARALTNVPIISPFARATEMGASTVAAIAKIFGYSSPNELSFSTMVPNPRPSFAVVDNKVPANKLTFDSKQELTIDPTTTGIRPDDELPIASIAGRESYLTTFDWDVTALTDENLFQIRVDPFVNRYLVSGREYHLPACAAAALPFKYWRGTMRFRFQIVSSNYHRGRLRLAYDPSGNMGTPEFNTHYTTIHDISTEKDFTVDIGWAQDVSFAHRITEADVSFVAPGELPDIPRGNGVLGVWVLNTLTVPSATAADVQVNVYVSMLDDFEVAQPVDLSTWMFRDNVDPVPETAEMEKDMDCCESPVTDPPKIDTMADALVADPDVNKLFFGEVVASFRQLLKRDCLAEIIQVDRPEQPSTFTFSRRAFPEYGGRTASAIFSNSMCYPVGTDNWVPVATTYINYISKMFLGWRGSIRWTIDTSAIIIGTQNEAFGSKSVLFHRQESTPRVNLSSNLGTSTLDPGVKSRILNNYKATTNIGSYLGNNGVNPIVPIEVPFYSNERFFLVNNSKPFFDVVEEPSWNGIFTQTDFSAADYSAQFFYLYCSAGEDFNLFYFSGMPALYKVVSFPIATAPP